MLEVLNRYAHGVTAIPIFHALRKRGLISRIEQSSTFSLSQLAREFSVAPGPLEVALKLLASLGWITAREAGLLAPAADLRLLRFIPEGIMELCGFPFESYVREPAGLSLAAWIAESERRWQCDHPMLADFLDGLLALPLLLALGAEGRLRTAGGGEPGSAPVLELAVDGAVRGEVERFFAARGWTAAPDGTPRLTRAGQFIVDRFFVTAALASYRPMLLRAEELLFGDAARVFVPDAAGHEAHLDRTLNVRGSGFQHEKYFAAVCDAIVPLFDGEEFDRQPRYIADMGCGDGSLLRRLFETVRGRTRRGRVLDRHPLTLIAIDHNERALAAAERTLGGLEHITLRGDIGEPEALLTDLAARGIGDAERILHVRSFLDHDRPWRAPEDAAGAARRARLGCSGTFIDAAGGLIPPDEMLQSTVEHLARWARVINRHGLLMLEVHCLPVAVTAQYLDESESFHFDAYHSLSHQFLLDADLFLLCAAEAGLFSREERRLKFPRHMPFARITLHHFVKQPYVVRHAEDADLAAIGELCQVWPAPAARPAVEPGGGGAASSRAGLLASLPGWQLVLQSAGRVVASVLCAPAEGGMRLLSVHALPGGEPAQARELVQFAAQYAALAGGAGQAAGLGNAPAVLGALAAAGALASLPPAAPPLALRVAQDMAAAAAALPFAAGDDPRSGERELADFAFRWFLALCQSRGALLPQASCTVAELRQRLAVAPKYGRYLTALLRRLAAAGLVIEDGERVAATARAAVADLAGITAAAPAFAHDLATRHPVCRGLLDLTLRGLGSYAEILSGEVDAAEVLFADADMGVFANLFRGDAVADHFNSVVAAAVRSAVAARLAAAGEPGGAPPPCRILEIGAGTGGTTEALLAALAPFGERAELCFSDLSPAFVRHARRRFAAAHPRLAYRLLDIEKDLGGQGLAVPEHDIVVAAHVLHDTRDIAFALAQMRRLLRPGGVLVLNEYTAVKDCLLFSGALLSGYWLFEDAERRLPDTCLLGVPQWRRALAESGFAPAGEVALPTQDTGGECSQCVLAAVAPATPAAFPAAAGIQAESAGGRSPGAPSHLLPAVEEDIRAILGTERAAAYSPRRPLMEMGLDSIELVEIKLLVGQRLGVRLGPSFLFEHETPEKMAAALAALVPVAAAGDALSTPPPAGGVHPPLAGPAPAPAAPPAAAPAVARVAPAVPEPLAVVGIACRFPGGASSAAAFWELLEGGVDAVGRLPEGRWRWPAWVDVEGEHCGIDRGAFLPCIDEFAAPFFRIARQEAEWMDPQQRLLLELSWEAAEDAGCRPRELAGRRIGVFIGTCQADYRDLLAAAAASGGTASGTGGSAAAYIGSGSAASMLANRLSYFYDLKGPSLTIDTACSSSLFALHEAAGALRRGECEQALVGAVNLMCSPTVTLSYHQAGMLSRAGRCRTFDAGADGYVRGEGGAMLLIKPLSMALAAGDPIHGLIRGTAVNHGGQATTLTAPRPDAQAEVVAAAWLAAGAEPRSAGCIEAHGTATPLGDPVEISGLKMAFARLYQERGETPPAAPHCALGSVKSNIGHLEGAAGLAGLIKVLLALERRQVPRTLHVRTVNPEIDLAGSPLALALHHAGWPRPRDAAGRELPRRGGVSSFGFGGANAHAVVEEHRMPRAAAAPPPAPRPCVVPLSAHSAAELRARVRDLLGLLLRSAEAEQSGQARAEAELAALLAGSFGLDAAGAADLEWSDLGWGAVEMQRFLGAAEESCGVRLPARSLVECPTPRHLANRIADQRRRQGAAGAARPNSAAAAAAFPAALAEDAEPPGAGLTLEEVAHTLQAGREPMAERLAFVASSLGELIASLRAHLAGEPVPRCHGGYARRQDAASVGLEGQAAARAARDAAMAAAATGDPEPLAALWAGGAEVDWSLLAAATRPRRVHLPSYPFARERYWVPAAAPPVPAPRPHPLLQRHEPGGAAPRFSALLTGGEPFLADHVIAGQRLLPAVAGLEMARAAVERVLGGGLPGHLLDGAHGIWLRDVSWLRPLGVGEHPVSISLELVPETAAARHAAAAAEPGAAPGPARARHAEAVLAFTIHSAPSSAPRSTSRSASRFAPDAQGEPLLHAQGRAGIDSSAAAAGVLDVDAVLRRCDRAHLSAADCYRAFAAMGFAYGPSHRCIAELHLGADEILARLVQPAPAAGAGDGCFLDPGMTDAAVQATLGFALAAGPAAAGQAPALPFELRGAEIWRASTPVMWSHVRRVPEPGGGTAGRQSFDIDLADEAGRLSARFRGWTARPLPPGFTAAPSPAVAALTAAGAAAAPAASVAHRPAASVAHRPAASVAHWPAAAMAHRPAAEVALGEQLLVPRWERVPGDSVPRHGLPAGRRAIAGGTARQRAAIGALDPEARALAVALGDSIAGLRQAVAAWGEMDELVWIVPHHPAAGGEDDGLLRAQEAGALHGFRLIKALLAAGYDSRPLRLLVVTTEALVVADEEPANPAHAAVHGLIGSLAKELPQWQVRLVDLPLAGEWPWAELLALAADPHGHGLAWRAGGWYRRCLAPFHGAADGGAPYRAGAVYVVIGGAGGVGAEWSEALLRRLPVQLVWIGRRPLDEAIAARLARLAEIGPAPLYMTADATDREQLTRARASILRQFGRIDGIVHAAMVLRDRSLAAMTEQEFRQAAVVRMAVCVRLAQVFAAEPLDFVLFFSSIAAFLRWPGQANYAAGCAFADAFARCLARDLTCRVRVASWGWWEGVGAAAGERHRAEMARRGLGAIGIDGAMAALDQLLLGTEPQLAWLALTDRRALAGLLPGLLPIAAGGTPADGAVTAAGAAVPPEDAGLPAAAELMALPRDAAAGLLVAHLRRRAAAILGADPAALDSRSRPFATALLGEFGMDSLSANSLRNALRQELAVDLAVHRIIADPVQTIAAALYEQLLLQQMSHVPEREPDEVTETFVF
jgi:acyl transferase domain-containing protein/SAM-dependent methyltransferase